MGTGKFVKLLPWFLEGFAVTWNPFTMAIALALEVIVRAVFKPETTPIKNIFFLLGALTGFMASYVAGAKPFFRWDDIWWMPTGIVLAAILGIPLTWYLERHESTK